MAAPPCRTPLTPHFLPIMLSPVGNPISYHSRLVIAANATDRYNDSRDSQTLGHDDRRLMSCPEIVSDAWRGGYAGH